MRRVRLGETGIETSCLGFGCASLGSRVAAADGVRAMAAAFDAGVTWFDLAPLYGGGRAEEIAGPFLRGRRDAVQICSKVGLAPAGQGGLKALLMPLARRVVATVPSLRSRIRGRGMQAAVRLELTAEVIHAGLEASLRRLGTDRLDLYALHDADAGALGRDEVLRALEDVVAAGKARAVAVASDADAAAAAIARGRPYGAVQLALGAPGEVVTIPAAAAAAGMGAIVHSVFGIGGAFDGLRARVAADPLLAARVDAAGGLSRLMLGRAFALNPGGVVLVSMFSERSRRENLAAAAEPPGEAVLDGLLGA
jgi:aryl-alcohol dehydrogenase-like predicted oxidoreductase